MVSLVSSENTLSVNQSCSLPFPALFTPNHFPSISYFPFLSVFRTLPHLFTPTHSPSKSQFPFLSISRSLLLPLHPNTFFCLSVAYSFSLYNTIPFSVYLSLTPSPSTPQFPFLSLSRSLTNSHAFLALLHRFYLSLSLSLPLSLSLSLSRSLSLSFLPLSLFSISLQTKVEISTTRFKLFLLDLFNSHTLFLLKGHTTKHPCLRRLLKKCKILLILLME